MSTLTSVPLKLHHYWQTLSQNPVAVKELRSRMRGRGTFVVLTLYLLFLTGMVGLIYHGYYSSQNGRFGTNLVNVGQSILTLIIVIQFFVVVFGSISFTAPAIIGEKERQTYDLLRTTSLSAGHLVLGKLLSALGYVLLLVLVCVPLESIALVIGGVSLSEIVTSQLMLITSAATFALIGLYASARARSLQTANSFAFFGAFLLIFGLPALTALLGYIFRARLVQLPDAMQVYLFLPVVYSNLPASLLLSAIILLEYGTLWAVKLPGSPGFWVISPWSIHVLFNILFSLFLYWRIVRLIQRIPDR